MVTIALDPLEACLVCILKK